jgi:hypothetical protein
MHEYPLTSTLSVSFQRYPYPTTGIVTALPSSWGALPFVVAAPRRLKLPCPDREAFWIGLVTSYAGPPGTVAVLVVLASGARLDAVGGGSVDRFRPRFAEITVPPEHAVVGIARGDATSWALTRDSGGSSAPACRTIELLSRPGSATEDPRKPDDPGQQHLPQQGGTPPVPSGHPPEARLREAEAADVHGTSVHVDLVEPEQFRTLTGQRLSSLGSTTRYRGWRLP